jgi:hypothetical protein
MGNEVDRGFRGRLGGLEAWRLGGLEASTTYRRTKKN